MRNHTRSLVFVVFAAFFCASVAAETRYPAKSWERHRSIVWSPEKLQAARKYSESLKTAAVMIVQNGAVVDEWGETSRKFNVHSIRKSFLSAMYGIHVAEGHIELRETLADLGIDDNAPVLTAEEKKATVADLLKARSGIYHPALYETLRMKEMRPARGSHATGAFWYYNNWDFNALGTIFERKTNTKIFEEFQRRIAQPLEMEDFTPADGEYLTGADSIHRAYPFRMTARDMARIGLLFLRHGQWRGKQIVPRDWIRESTTGYSDASLSSKGARYGYMWWVSPDSYSARGAGGHFIVVMPSMDLVVVHRVNTDQPNAVSNEEFFRLLAMIVDAGKTPAAQPPIKSQNPAVSKVVGEVSQDRIAEIMKKLESFETRHTFSATDHPARGIGAARRWIYEQFRSYSPRLEVRLDTYNIKRQQRISRDVELANVVAVLPGKLQPERQVIISGHYDSLRLNRRSPEEAAADPPGMDAAANAGQSAPGVSDDASGTAAVMELARVMSQYEFDKTVVFVAFAGEEQGLLGSTLYAAQAARDRGQIEAVLNNDIIGNDVSGDGRSLSRSVRVFSEDPADSPSRQLARYIKEAGERYLPAMTVDLVFRHDRFGRGGDHTPFNQEGFAAVRFTTPAEFYRNQHSLSDTFANSSPAYTTMVTKINGAALATLALAPKTPSTTREPRTGRLRGRVLPNLGRGRSGYAAQLRWTDEFPAPDLAGYSIVMRSTRAPYWEKEFFAGNVREYLMESVSIDDVVFGVKAVDAAGNESLVSAFVTAPASKRVIEIAAPGQ
ncbi:MAG: M28 family peptidase [Bryobacteraceae bacterium]